MMHCPEVEQLISAYIDGEVSEIEKHNIEQHLKGCTSCRAVYNQTLKVVTSLQEIQDSELPQNYSIELHKRLEEATREQSRGWIRFFNSPRFKTVAGIAACLLVLFIGRNVIFDNMHLSKEDAIGETDAQALRSARMEKDGATMAGAKTAENAESTCEDDTDTAMGIMDIKSFSKGDGDIPEREDGTIDKHEESLVFEESSHLKVCISVNSDSPEKHLANLKSYAKEEGASISGIETEFCRLDMKIEKERFTDFYDHLVVNYGIENVNCDSRVLEEPSYSIHDLYERYNEISSRMEERNTERSEAEKLRIMAQKDLLIEMINELESEKDTATVSVIFQEIE